ncbi:MAG TPA: SPOR domain-containing protein [Pseudogracilibacillus sp.]|nr:SPOR domain-containing protein [Pseudogracilibacillus sp.]
MKMKEKLHQIRRNIQRQLRPYQRIILQFTITALSALTIGAVFGIFVLQLSQEDDKSVSSEVKQETGSKTSIPGISFYVVQAGLFADRANAEQVQANLTSKKGVAAIWQDKEEFYLFTGLANSEEKVRKKIPKDSGFFMKEWSIKSKDVELSASERTFFNELIEATETSLKQLDEGKMTTKQWTSLVENIDETKAIQPFKAHIEKTMAEKIDNPAAYERFLLEILHLYAQL